MITLRAHPHPLVGLLLLAVDVLLIWGTVTIASSKRRNPWVWGIIAFFIPLIMLIVIALVPASGGPSSSAA